MRRMALAGLVIVLLLVVQRTSAAQSSVGVRGYSTFGSTSLSAADSFEAVAGTSSTTGIGGGVTVTNIWKGLFVDVGLSQLALDGERVFIHGGTIYRLGIPVDITIRPLDAAAGWRRTRGRLSPYVGVGMSTISYKETSAFAASGDDVSERTSGPLFLAGADVGVLRWLHVGGEVRYRSVTGVLGKGGVSEVYGENQLGGVAAGLRLSVGR
jgi:hypothetical protein